MYSCIFIHTCVCVHRERERERERETCLRRFMMKTASSGAMAPLEPFTNGSNCSSKCDMSRPASCELGRELSFKFFANWELVSFASFVNEQKRKRKVGENPTKTPFVARFESRGKIK